MKHSYHKKLVVLIAFSVAMGFLESSVVVYLRALYYPEGFCFPLKNMDQVLMLTELLREFATLIMLFGAGYLFGNNVSTRFAGFILSFAVWDIFYYVFLYALINWPSGPGDWDILFLLPCPWYGPVWAPVSISLLMICYGLLIVYANQQAFPVKAGRTVNVLITLGVLFSLYTMMEDSILLLFNGTPIEQIALQHIPVRFNTSLFAFSCGFYLFAGIVYLRKIRAQKLHLISAMF